jgi:hypothetical protein
VRSDCCFVKGLTLTLFNTDGTLRAFSQTGSESVAETIGEQHSLAVDHPNGSFSAGGDALPAPVAFLLVDPDYLALDRTGSGALHTWLLSLLWTFSGFVSGPPVGEIRCRPRQCVR